MKFLYLPTTETKPEKEPRLEGRVLKYPCPCCGKLTFPVPKEEAVAYICPICWWENDVFDPGEDDPSDENRGMTLRQGRENYERYGAVRPDLAERSNGRGGHVHRAALEYNEKGCLLWSLECPGAFARGETREEACAKLYDDIAAWCRWSGQKPPQGDILVVEETYQPELKVEDADSDMLFELERHLMSREEYDVLRELVLKSARDFEVLYASIPDPDAPLGEPRATFYGDYPNTARKMYVHTNSVTAYYVGELDAQVDNRPGFYENRLNGLDAIERIPNVLNLPVIEGSYDELWSLRKVLRRFLWHDRIHARAMYRRAKAVWGDQIPDPFRFDG